MSGSFSMREGGGEADKAGGCNLLALGIASLVVDGRGSWGALRVVCGSTMRLVACSSPHASLLSSNLGSLGIPAQSPDPTNASHWGLFSLLLGLNLSSLSSSALLACISSRQLCRLASSSPSVSSSPLTSSFVSSNTVHTSPSSFLHSSLTLSFIQFCIIVFVLTITSLMVTMAVSGFLSLAGGLMVAWVVLGMIGSYLGHSQMVERKWWVGASDETCCCVQLLLVSLWLCKKWVGGHIQIGT